MKQATWFKGALVVLLAMITVLGGETLAVARPDRTTPTGERDVASLLGSVSVEREAPSSGRQSGTSDGIVSESMSASGLTVAQDGCGEATYSMSIAAAGPTPVGSWNASVTITDPQGTLTGVDHLSNYIGTGSMYLCASEGVPGTYVATATWTAYDESSAVLDQGTDTVSFTFSITPAAPKARQRITFHKYHWGSRGWRVTGTLTRAGHRRARVKVYVAYIRGGYGFDIFPARTNRHGVATWHFRPKSGAGRFRLSLHAPEDATSDAAWSHIFRLPHRG